MDAIKVYEKELNEPVTVDGLKNVAIRVSVFDDMNPSDPREESNVFKMVCWHRNYNLGDDKEWKYPDDFQEYMDSLKDKKQEVVIYKLFLYDHSGITISLSTFAADPQGWDTSCVGYIYATKETIFAELGGVTEENWEQKALEYAQAEVDTYDQYLRGDVYGFVIDRIVECPLCGERQERRIDSCWGFYDYEESLENFVKESGYDLKDFEEVE